MYSINIPTRFQAFPTHKRKDVLCLLIAAHNEELVLGRTISSAITAGMKPQHIYVVDDNSVDKTSEIALSILPPTNILKVGRSGKGLALSKASRYFCLTSRYRWIHIADADGAFSPNYFPQFRKELRISFAAATGYIKSLPGARISEFRAYEYTIGMELHRRVQSLLGVIPVIPGPTSCFRSDVFDKLDFSNKSLTEDFDVTLQLYRKNLGKIKYISSAIAYTQDPLTIKMFMNQITRWNRGVMQGILKHKISNNVKGIDAYLTYQIMQSILLGLNCLAYIPYMTLVHGGTSYLAIVFLMDVFLTLTMVYAAAIKSKRFDLISAFPFIYALKWLGLYVFLKSFVEVVVLKRFQVTEGTWENGSGRRYDFTQQN